MSRSLSVRRTSLSLLVCTLGIAQLGPLFGTPARAAGPSGAGAQDASCAPAPLGPAARAGVPNRGPSWAIPRVQTSSDSEVRRTDKDRDIAYSLG